MSTTPPEATDTATDRSRYYDVCAAVANYMLGDYCGATARCQQIRGEHKFGHWSYSSSSKIDRPDDPKFKDVVTIKVSWRGDFVEEKHSSK